MRSVNRAYAAVVFGIVVIIGLVAVNAWLGREIARTRIQASAVPPEVSAKPVMRPTARIPVIDPLSDPLAPVFNTQTPAVSKSSQQPPRKSLPIYESMAVSDVLLQ